MVPREERRPGKPKWGTGGLELKLLEAWQCPASGQTQPPWDQQHRAGPGRKRKRKGVNTPRRDKTHPTIARPVQGGGRTRASVKQEGALLLPQHLTRALSSQYPTPLRGVHEAGDRGAAQSNRCCVVRPTRELCPYLPPTPKIPNKAREEVPYPPFLLFANPQKP